MCHKGSILFFFYEHFIWPGLSTITFTFFLLTAASFSFSFEKKEEMCGGRKVNESWPGRTWSLFVPGKTILWRSRDRRLVSLPVVDSPKDEWFPQGTNDQVPSFLLTFTFFSFFFFKKKTKKETSEGKMSANLSTWPDQEYFEIKNERK